VGVRVATTASKADNFFHVEHIQDQLDHDYQLLDAISRIAIAIKQEIDGARQRCPDISAREFAAVFEEVVIQSIAPTSSVAVNIAELIAYGVMETDAAEIVLNVVLPPIDLAANILSSFNLARASAYQQLTDIVKQLKERQAAIEDLRVIMYN
jgi:hypothetical protein